MIKISEEIIKVLDNLATKFGIVIDWSSQNIVPYLQEVVGRCVNYKMYTAIMWIVVMIVMIIIDYLIFKIFWNNYKRDKCFKTKDNLLFASMVCGFVMLFLFVFVILNANTIIACLTFPEKIVLDYLTAL